MFKKFLIWMSEEKFPYLEYIHEDHTLSDERLTKVISCVSVDLRNLAQRVYYMCMASKQLRNKAGWYLNFTDYLVGYNETLRQFLRKYDRGEFGVFINVASKSLEIIDYNDDTDNSYRRSVHSFPLEAIRKYRSIRGFRKYFLEEVTAKTKEMRSLKELTELRTKRRRQQVVLEALDNAEQDVNRKYR